VNSALVTLIKKIIFFLQRPHLQNLPSISKQLELKKSKCVLEQNKCYHFSLPVTAVAAWFLQPCYDEARVLPLGLSSTATMAIKNVFCLFIS
jgi:hypothetical protein